MEPNDKTESEQTDTAHESTSRESSSRQAERHPEWAQAADEAREDAVELWQKTEGALRKPLVGAGIAGAIVLAAAAVWGAPEAAVGAAAAYGVYWLVRNRGKGQSERRSDTRSSGDEPRREAASAATAHPGHT